MAVVVIEPGSSVQVISRSSNGGDCDRSRYPASSCSSVPISYIASFVRTGAGAARHKFPTSTGLDEFVLFPGCKEDVTELI